MLKTYYEEFMLLLSDPTSNLVGAAIGVSIVVVILVILVLVLLFFALSGSSRDASVSAPRRRKKKVRKPTAEEIARREAKVRRARRLTSAIVSLGVLAAWVVLFAGTSASVYCGSTCHAMVKPADAWRASDHSGVRCIRCHEGTLATSFVTGPLHRAHSMVQAVFNVPSSGAFVPSQRCLTCHAAVLEKTIVSGRAVAMSHAEPIAAGATCSDCHGAQGHVTEKLIIGMPACLRCHDGELASVECAVCHPKGVEASISQPAEPVGPAVRLPAKPTCGGCHSQKTCDECHGVRMPHPVDFADPHQHAPLAAFELKERVCYRCHTQSGCVGCHPSFSAHGPDWKRDHKTYKFSDGSGYCKWCHETDDFCRVCH